ARRKNHGICLRRSSQGKDARGREKAAKSRRAHECRSPSKLPPSSGQRLTCQLARREGHKTQTPGRATSALAATALRQSCDPAALTPSRTCEILRTHHPIPALRTCAHHRGAKCRARKHHAAWNHSVSADPEAASGTHWTKVQSLASVRALQSGW